MSRVPSRSSMIFLQAGRLTWWRVWTGRLTVRSSSKARSSIIARTSGGGAELEQVGDVAVVRVADDDVQPGRGRATACGSSRVLTIGRFRVVSSPTSTSKKSLRWLIWNPAVRESCPIPTRPEPHITLARHEERDEVADDAERRLPAHQVVLVGAVGGTLAVGVVLVQVHARGHLREAAHGPA